MRAFVLFATTVLNSLVVCKGQSTERVIQYDQKGRLTTTYTTTTSRTSYLMTYLGSPFWGNIAWHQGALMYKNGREVAGQIAYDLESGRVYWRLNDSTEVSQALPEKFTIENQRFISEQHKPLGIDQVSFYEVLYDGPTKLFCKWTKRVRGIEPKLYTHRTLFEDRFAGEYILAKDIYIQKAGEHPKFIIPTEYSLSRVLPNMGDKLANFIAANPLTDQILVEALIQYDRRPDLPDKSQ